MYVEFVLTRSLFAMTFQAKGTNRAQTSRLTTEYPGYEIPEHELDATGLSDIPFGREMKKEFALKQDTIFLNHGSYGAVPKRLLKLQHEYIMEREEHPDMFHRLYAKSYADKSRQAIASTINADVDNVLLVPNATTAMNSLMQSYPFKSGDGLLVMSLTFSPVNTMLSHFLSRIRTDVERVCLDISFPIQSEDELVESYEDILDKNPHIKVAFLDHITSPTSILMPVARLVRSCHSRNVVAFIDGAHCIGQIPLDMEELQADAYVANLHKWNYCPRGTTLLWFAEKHRSWLGPLNRICENSETLDYQFLDQGTIDVVPFTCARHALQFYNAIGGMDKILSYTSKLANDMREMLHERLGLEALAVPQSMEAPNMKFIKLPHFPNEPINAENNWVLLKDLFGGSNLFGSLTTFNGDYYLRISVQVYNSMDDFLQLADILQPFIDRHT